VANWKIIELDTKPLLDGLPDVVVGAKWSCELESQGQRADISGQIQFTPPNPMDYTMYPNLTEAQVLGWLWSVIDREYIESMLQGQINQVVHPDPETPPLPWG
jgi:hypothetical protein